MRAFFDGGCSSVGRVPDCDSGCRGFEPHQSPQNSNPENRKVFGVFCFYGLPNAIGRTITQRNDSVESRLTDIEIKLSYAEDMLDELNRTVFRQQQQIDLLMLQVKALREQVQNAEPAEARSLRDEIPPHY